WLYDPEAGTFTPRAAMPSAQELIRGVTVTVAGRTEVHVFGGQGSGTVHLIHDVLSDTWRNGPPIPIRVSGPAVVQRGARIYVVGGNPVARTQIYEPGTGTWSLGPPNLHYVENTSGDVVDNVFFLLGGSGSSGRLDSNYAWIVE